MGYKLNILIQVVESFIDFFFFFNNFRKIILFFSWVKKAEFYFPKAILQPILNFFENKCYI